MPDMAVSTPRPVTALPLARGIRSVSQPLLEALCNPAIYPHPVQQVRLLETHISWVLLTGEYAYKIKKPVNFGFLDFSTLEARQHFCQQELLLNQRMAPELYQEVLPITGTPQNPVIGGSGKPIEYLLKMREFPQENLLDQIQSRGELHKEHIDTLAQLIASSHQNAPVVAAEHPLNTTAAIVAPMRQNFEQIRPFLDQPADLQQLEALEAWTEAAIKRLTPVMDQRCRQGMIRECHGDLHLGNAAMVDGQILLFDCIEFNEPFRFIDVALDAAFMAMDLEDRGLHALSRRFLNNWLEHSGDHQSLQVINLYKAYRALVRAKVNLFRLTPETGDETKAAILAQYRSYADLAERYSHIPQTFLAITRGVSAVGKSLVALHLVEELGAIRIRSDVERKRLFDNQHTSTLNAGLYSPECSIATYERLHQLAHTILQAGFPVVLDATYLRQDQRQVAQQTAESLAVPFLILDCQAPEKLILQWLAQRQAAATDPSDATEEVIRAQQANQDPLTPQEQGFTLTIDTRDPITLQNALQAVSEYLIRI